MVNYPKTDEDQPHINQETIRFFLKILERGRSALSSFCKASQRSNIIIESKLVKMSSTPVNLIFTFSVAPTGNQSWIFQNNRETKHQSMEWRIKSDMKAPKILLAKVQD
jgi:CMP-2-keto-3-deoxyoctulosonic acid synthetase